MEQQEAVGDGLPAEASVYVVTTEGEILDSAAVLQRAVKKGAALRKASQQLSDPRRHGRWVEPRIAYDDLLAFYDWNPWHRRSIGVKALLTGGLGWTLTRDGAALYDSVSGEGDEADPAVALLLRPSPDEPLLTFDDVLHRLLVDYEATGDYYAEVVRNGRGRIAELYHVPARTMRRGGRRRNTYWQLKNGRQKVFGAFDPSAREAGNTILHGYQYDPKSDDYGMPGWVGALASMGLDRTVLEFNTRLFQNSMMAHLAIVVEGGRLSADGRAAVKQFVRDRATGVENAGRILLIEDENDHVTIRFEKLNLDVKDLMLTGIQNHFRDVVVGAHGVPPRILGIVSPGQLGATGEVEGQLRIFRETTLRPGQRQLTGTLNRLLDEVEPGTRITFNELDITALEADARLLDTLLRHAVFGRTEALPIAERLVAG